MCLRKFYLAHKEVKRQRRILDSEEHSLTEIAKSSTATAIVHFYCIEVRRCALSLYSIFSANYQMSRPHFSGAFLRND